MDDASLAFLKDDDDSLGTFSPKALFIERTCAVVVLFLEMCVACGRSLFLESSRQLQEKEAEG